MVEECDRANQFTLWYQTGKKKKKKRGTGGPKGKGQHGHNQKTSHQASLQNLPVAQRRGMIFKHMVLRRKDPAIPRPSVPVEPALIPPFSPNPQIFYFTVFYSSKEKP